MHRITDADREAAKALREILADVSGFWHHSTDDSALCRALARHRIEAEERLMGKLTPLMKTAIPANDGESEERPGAKAESFGPNRVDRLAI